MYISDGVDDEVLRYMHVESEADYFLELGTSLEFPHGVYSSILAVSMCTLDRKPTMLTALRR